MAKRPPKHHKVSAVETAQNAQKSHPWPQIMDAALPKAKADKNKVLKAFVDGQDARTHYDWTGADLTALAQLTLTNWQLQELFQDPSQIGSKRHDDLNNIIARSYRMLKLAPGAGKKSRESEDERSRRERAARDKLDGSGEKTADKSSKVANLAEERQKRAKFTAAEKRAPKLPSYVVSAIKSGPVPKVRALSAICNNPRTDGEQVIKWASENLVVPDGQLAGQPLRLDVFQKAFIIAIFDNPEETRRAILSIARRNGKSFVIAVILLAFLVGPMKRQNTVIASAANSRDQAALVFEMMRNMLDMSPSLEGAYKTTESSKMIKGLEKNVTYKALSAEAKTGHGQSLYVILLDEAGQIQGEVTPFVSMLTSSQGSYEDPKFFMVSTQAPTDADYLSVQIDHATRTGDPHIVCHVYAADPDCDLMDEAQWQKANPGLGIFRSKKDLREQLKKANEIPSEENEGRNLLLNQRVSMDTLFMAPNLWRKNNQTQDDGARGHALIHLGLDLSQRTDLTACAAAWRNDDGEISVETHTFAPQAGVKQREMRDKAPYTTWAHNGFLQLTPGGIVEYKWVAEFLALKFAGCKVASVQFDRYRIELFKEAAKQTDFYAMVGEWVEVIQGAISLAPRMEAFEAEMLAGRIRHGSHPLLNMAASNAIAVKNANGDRRLDKSKSTQRIDPMAAAVMAVFPCSDGQQHKQPFNVDSMIG